MSIHLCPRRPAAVGALLLALVLSGAGPARAAAPAAPAPVFLRLLRIMENKGMLSPREAASLRRDLEAQEQDLRQRRRDLEAWERALEQRERALVPGKGAPSAGEEKAAAGWPVRVSYHRGLVFSSPDPNRFHFRLGTLLQADYRRYFWAGRDPNQDRFDLRRVRLFLEGRVGSLWRGRFEYEFQGAGSRHLLDAWVQAQPWSLARFRLGQFKTPFGLETSTKDRDIFFAERSMGYWLGPRRDLGLMAWGTAARDRLWYGLGLFNGDGSDDTTGGDQDEPSLVGRLVWAPFRLAGPAWLRGLQLGGSFSYADIDRNNVHLEVRTPGYDTFLSFTSSAKFGVVREAGHLERGGLELAWNWGPLAFMAEHTRLQFQDLVTSEGSFDLAAQDTYLAGLWMLTGEQPRFERGVLQPIFPRRGLGRGAWGAWGLALRWDHFEAGEEVYRYLVDPGISVRRADALSLALNWWLDDSVRLILDYTHTNFDRPLMVGRDPLTGEGIYHDDIDLVTLRCQFGL